MYVLKLDFPWWENDDPPNPLKRHWFREGRAVLQGCKEERALSSTCTGREGVKALSRCLHQAPLCLPSGAKK